MEAKGSPPTPSCTPEPEHSPGDNYNPDLGVYGSSMHEETKEAPLSTEVGLGAEEEPRASPSSTTKRFFPSEAQPKDGRGGPMSEGMQLTPTAPSAPPPSTSAGRPRPPSTGRSSFSNSPRMNRRRQGSFGSDLDNGNTTPTCSAGSSPTNSRVQTPSGNKQRQHTPPCVVEGKEDEPSSDPPLPPSSSEVDKDFTNNSSSGATPTATTTGSSSRRSSRGRQGLLSTPQSFSWGTSPDARVEYLTLMAVGVGVSPMIRILRAGLELSTKLHITFLFGVR